MVQLLQSETHVEGALHAEVVVGGGRETLECVTDVHERAVGVRRAEEGFKDGQGGGLEGVETALDAAAAVGGAILQAAFAEEVKGGLELAWGGAGEGGDGGVDPLGSVPDLVSVGHDGRGDARGRGRGADAPSESTSYASATRAKMVAASSELSLSGWYLRASLRYLRRAKGGGA